MAKPDNQNKLRSDAAEVTAKIVASYEKLAGKFREKSQRAAERVKSAKSESKRAMYRRRFESYGDAAQDLDEQVTNVRARHEQGSD